MTKKVNELFNGVIKMNIGFDEDEKTLCIFDDAKGGILIAELGYKITKSKCDCCDECLVGNRYEEYFLDECLYGVDPDLRYML